MHPVLAVATGDPAGIGPEITVKAAKRLLPRIRAGEFSLVALGAGSALRAAVEMVEDAPAFPHFDAAASPQGRGGLAFMDVAPGLVRVEPGNVSAEAGHVAYEAARRAAEMTLGGEAHAIVTAPLNKEAMIRAGHRFAGYTELLAHLTGRDGPVMMLAHGDLRVSHVTTHVALRRVPELLTRARLERVIRLTQEALIDFEIRRPRIAVAALNPHAGEGGNFGSEDDEVTAPVVQALCSQGIIVEGPVPGDTVFVKAVGGQYDAVVAMYHDQGHVPVKLLGFSIDRSTGQWTALNGVNITLGLPVLRTSVDHGTAFDIAGQGIAREDSMVEAIEVALRLVRGRSLRSQDAQTAPRAKIAQRSS